MAGRPWVVVKFGGTSVSAVERWETIAEVTRQRLDAGLRPLIVCSALSGISNRLDALLDEALTETHEDTLEAIFAQHRALAADLGVDADAILGTTFDALRRMALGASLTGEASPRLQARVMAQGELMSTRLGVAWLQAQGLRVAWEDARDLLTAEHDESGNDHRRFLSATCAYDPDPDLQQRLSAVDADAIITQGFIARDEAGDTVLLGRGGSDTSAAYFAARLGAVRCEIWTDVPGMYTANPRQIPSARLLKTLEYDEAQEIASTGAKVLHPRAIAPARKHDIPLHILCTWRPDIEGTRISSRSTFHGAQVKAVSARSGITLISMDTGAMWQQVGFLADVFQVFKKHGLSIDLVSTSEMNVTVSLDPSANALEPTIIEALLRDLNRVCRARRIGPCTAVSLVGRNIRGILHKLGPVFELFEELKVHLVSQAASDLNLTFVVDEGEATRLTQRLHAHLFDGHDAPSDLGPSWQETFEPDTDDEDDEEDEGEGEAPTPRWWVTHRAALLQLAPQAGSPLYVYNRAQLADTARRIVGLSAIRRAFYAVKANPNPDILRIFHELGLGFECVSPGELDHILELFPTLDRSRLLFTPNFAPRSEYAYAFERGAQVTLDNLHPLRAWPELLKGREILVRLDPGQGRGHHKYVRTAGAYSKFGVAFEQLDELAELVEQHEVRVVGLHAHTGSGIRDPESWLQTALYLAEIAQRFPEVRVLDIGGGLGVPERTTQSPLDLDAVNTSLLDFLEAHPRFELWLEPGRFLVAAAGVLLATCTQLKQKGPVHYVGLDVGMNSLIRPALYGAHHDIVNLTRYGQPRTLVANVVGPICESGDTLGYSRRLPKTDEGDLFLIATAGAYGRAMSSRYNLREPAREVFLNPPVEG